MEISRNSLDLADKVCATGSRKARPGAGPIILVLDHSETEVENVCPGFTIMFDTSDLISGRPMGNNADERTCFGMTSGWGFSSR